MFPLLITKSGLLSIRGDARSLFLMQTGFLANRQNFLKCLRERFTSGFLDQGTSQWRGNGVRGYAGFYEQLVRRSA